MVRLTVKGIPGLSHVLEGSSDLFNWSPLLTNVPASEIFQFDAVDPVVARRSYRAVEMH
jgi:hypothetical protein